ncbi:hypothetical protein IKE13_03230 [Candidatus Saccharibacteria bacterium]|nr:hypothetical protein [Candidatus Saccharibacteria bacterium]
MVKQIINRLTAITADIRMDFAIFSEVISRLEMNEVAIVIIVKTISMK